MSDEALVGLCAACRSGRRVTSAKGSVFWRCARSDTDPRFRKYPALPVLRCDGFVAAGDPGRQGDQR